MDEGPQEIRPLVYDGVMYIAHPNADHIQALDATTGDLIWNYERDLPADLREYVQLGGRTRHLAIYGDSIFHLTADAYLLALDAQTGEMQWESQMADYRDGITHSSGAMIMKGQVVTGRTCSPSSLDARCFIAAHDPTDWQELWRTYTRGRRRRPRWRDLGHAAYVASRPRIAMGTSGKLRPCTEPHLLGHCRTASLSTPHPAWNLGCRRQHTVRVVLQLNPRHERRYRGDRLVLPTPALR